MPSKYQISMFFEIFKQKGAIQKTQNCQNNAGGGGNKAGVIILPDFR